MTVLAFGRLKAMSYAITTINKFKFHIFVTIGLHIGANIVSWHRHQERSKTANVKATFDLA